MKKTVFFFLLFALSFSIFAGDIANYVNLGFSQDSKIFMFGYYGIDNEKNNPYAEIYTVDTYANEFVPNGIKKEIYNIDIQPGQKGVGALLTLLKNNKSIEKYKINHMKTGRVVYLLINGNEPKSRLEFRDFNKGSKYIVVLEQFQFGIKKDISSSFYINLSVTSASGKTKTYTIGLPDYKRKGVKSYRIKQVVFSPDESSLVFIIEKEKLSTDGINIRYMVETVKLK